MTSDFTHDKYCPCAQKEPPLLDDYEPVTPESRSVEDSPRLKGWLRIAAAAESTKVPAYTITRLVQAGVILADYYQDDWYVDPEGLPAFFDPSNADEIYAKTQAVEQWQSDMRAFERRRLAVHEKWMREQEDTSDDRYSSSPVSEDSSARSQSAKRLATFLNSWASKSSCVKVLPKGT